MNTQDIINCWETGVEPYNAPKHQPYTTVWTNHGDFGLEQRKPENPLSTAGESEHDHR